MIENQVENELFPDLQSFFLTIRSVRFKEEFVDDYVKRVKAVFRSNTFGPMEYMSNYNKYLELVGESAKAEIKAFTSEPQLLESYNEVLFLHFFDLIILSEC